MIHLQRRMCLTDHVKAANLSDSIQTVRSFNISLRTTHSFPWEYVNFLSQGESALNTSHISLELKM